MKITFGILIIVSGALILIMSCAYKHRNYNRLPLDNNWKVKLGDSIEWANSNYDDALWDSVKINQKGCPVVFDKYDGYGWFRYKIYIPSTLKKSTRINDSIRFFLGKIDDCDQVYLNGFLLGENAITASGKYLSGEAFTKAENLFVINRKYTVSFTDVRVLWDTINVIAIRVFDQYKGGGLCGSKPFIGPTELEDYFIMDFSRFYKVIGNDSIDKRFSVRNISGSTTYSGQLSLTARKAGENKAIFTWNSFIKIMPGDTLAFPVALPFSTDSLLIHINFFDDRTGEMVLDSSVVPYSLEPE